MHFEKIQIREALRDLVAMAEKGNEIMSTKEPWKLVKNHSESAEKEFKNILNDLLYLVRAVSILLWPFSPHASEKALKYFNIEKPFISEINKELSINLEPEIKSIFNKITEIEIAKLEKFSK